MRTVEDYAKIRRAHRDGLSVNEIGRRFHHSKHTISKALANAVPAPYSRGKSSPCPVLGPFHSIIQQILMEDEDAPPKQRHTYMRLFERLRDERGYEGGYDAVRRYASKIVRPEKETFIPLSHDAGQRMECDFGHIYVDMAGERRQVPVLIMVWSHSNCPFAMALPNERTEAILDGMVRGLEFFGVVPREVWWDNPKTVAELIFVGRDRKPNNYYAALCSHYVMEPLYCMPAKGNEKPVVENRVKTLQRRWATPVPKVGDLAELNAYLRECCLKDRERPHGDSGQTIGERFTEDLAGAGTPPAHKFDPCVREERCVDKYQTIHFDNVRYSVPRSAAFQMVTVKGYTDHVEIVWHGKMVARHTRVYERNVSVLDPIHFLVTLGRRPAALDHSDVYRSWQLPPCFENLRHRLEERHGPRPGVRHYIRVLQLLAEHTVEQVRRVIETLYGVENLDAERIAERVRRRLQREDKSLESCSEDRADTVNVGVPNRGLGHFDQLLSQGGENDDQRTNASSQDEPQATSATDDALGVRETGPRSGARQPELRGLSTSVDGVGGLHANCQCIVSTYQTGILSDPQGLRHL